MNRHEANKRLIEAGLATDQRSADALRMGIKDMDVEGFIRSKAQAAPGNPGIGENKEVKKMREIVHLMRQEKLDFGSAGALYHSLNEQGITIESYLKSDASLGAFGEGPTVPTTELFRQAGEIIRLAGSKERAIKAINHFDDVEKSTSAPEDR